MDNLPSQEEQDEVRAYCCERELVRPATDIKRAVLFAASFVLLCTLLCIAGVQIASRLGAHYEVGWLTAHPVLSGLLICFFIISLCTLLVLRPMVIGLVHLYQHYASEKLRRKCILKPTCSEYMILAVKKYGVFRGVYKGVYRLLYTCRGFVYRIDEP